MPILALNHYNLRAARATLDGLRDFYCKVVGLREGPRPPFGNFGYWLYAGERAVLHLSEARPEEVHVANVDGTFDHVAFDCAGRAQMEAHLTSQGVTYRTAEVPLTGLVQLFFKDPVGNGVELSFSSNER